MGDALHKGCDNIITCGGIQSNHSRITAVAATQLGMKPHLVLRTTTPMVHRFQSVCLLAGLDFELDMQINLVTSLICG